MIYSKAVSRAVGQSTEGEHLMYGSWRTLEDGQSTREKSEKGKRKKRVSQDSRFEKRGSPKGCHEETEKGGAAGGHAGGQLQVVYRLDKAEIVTYRESRVTIQGISMIHHAIYTVPI